MAFQKVRHHDGSARSSHVTGGEDDTDTDADRYDVLPVRPTEGTRTEGVKPKWRVWGGKPETPTGSPTVAPVAICRRVNVHDLISISMPQKRDLINV